MEEPHNVIHKHQAKIIHPKKEISNFHQRVKYELKEKLRCGISHISKDVLKAC